MSLQPAPLPTRDLKLLQALARIVPASDRAEWSRTWHAELWHLHHRSRHQARLVTADLSLGIARDALWLRGEGLRRALSGTGLLCLASLTALSLFAALIALLLQPDWHPLGADLKRCLFAAPIVVFVAFATISRRHVEQTASTKGFPRIRRQLFFTFKTLLVLLLAFLVSANFVNPLRAISVNTADLGQVFAFVLLALIGMRWAVQDQELRCKQCMRSLTTPARVGRPSHNLLEWNGTELACRNGHGLLSVPEIETSWCQSSSWITLEQALK